MASSTCAHDIWQRDKFGTQGQGNLEVCNGCGLPTEESYQRAVSSGQQIDPTSPVERARKARAEGKQFFEIQLEVGVSSRDVRFLEADSGHRTEQDNGQILQDIEAEGWNLHAVGYVFVPTGQSSRQKMLGSGASVAISGVTVGVYLFRASAETEGHQ